MGTIKTLNRFEFDQHRITYDKVSFKLADILTSEINGYWNFTSDGKIRFRKSKVHAIAVNGFQKPMSDLVTYIVINTEDFFGPIGVQQFGVWFFHF